jgi:ribosomal-protein-alanine N-acetyltransferase
MIVRTLRLVKPSPIKTARLILRPLTDADAPSIAALAGDWDIARMTARIPYPYSAGLAQQWIDGLAHGEVVRGITHNGELIGVTGYLPDAEGSAEVGYWIGKPWWGHGFATEAAEAMIRYCFAASRVTRVTCSHFVDNPASQRVITKLGFRLLGTARAYCDARRRDIATLRYERLRPRRFSWLRRAA